nr:N-acetyl sugar amidotransferase [uncultured Methanoregula sp.]
MQRQYQICNKCVMDTTDPEIQFDEQGICNHCKQYDELVAKHVKTGEPGRLQLNAIIKKVKEEQKKKEYDCIIGMSGGVDSSYVACKVRELGLRPLAVHLDNGWDSELAVKNIELLLKKLDIDLYTHVIDWDEFRDIQLSFLRASTPDSEIPSDHAIFSVLYQMANKIGTKYIILGNNIRTETHLPATWSQGHMDWKYIYSVHKKFGSVPFKTFPHLDFFQYQKNLLLNETVNILDYLDYSKKDALQYLEKEVGWRYYGGKHYESIYTRFFQGYILPKKFGFDKRKSHLSSLICSGEMERKDALNELKSEPYPVELQNEDKTYVIKKLGLTEQEFGQIMANPPKTFWDYPSYRKTLANPLINIPFTYSFRALMMLKRISHR